MQETLFLDCLSHKDKCKNSYMPTFAHTYVTVDRETVKFIRMAQGNSIQKFKDQDI
jgi:hypothetical protein